MRTTLLCALAAAIAASITFAIATQRGEASGQTTRVHNVRLGDSILIRGLDLLCAVLRKDHSGQEEGPVMLCFRFSANSGRTRVVGASRYHYWVSDRQGNRTIYRVDRSP
jgi:hypothetical protein